METLIYVYVFFLREYNKNIKPFSLNKYKNIIQDVYQIKDDSR